MTTRVDELIGQRVRVRRELMLLTQEDLAARLGLSEWQIARYERGVDRISASMLLMMCRVLSVSITFFFEDLLHASGLN